MFLSIISRFLQRNVFCIIKFRGLIYSNSMLFPIRLAKRATKSFPFLFFRIKKSAFEVEIIPYFDKIIIKKKMPSIYWYVTSIKIANSFKETASSLEAERRHREWFKLPTIQNRLFRPRDQNGSTSSEREKK